MSDFLYTSRRTTPGVLRAALERYLHPLAGDYAEQHGDWGSLATFLPPHESHAVTATSAHISVLVGNPLVRLPGLPPRLLHYGERRSRLHELGARPDARIEEVLDGHFAMLSVDTRSGSGRVLTDRFAFIPVFTARTEPAGLVVGTHVDAVAAGAGCDVLDPVSIADFVGNLTCMVPWTIYRGVRQLTAAAEHGFGAHDWTSAPRVYWFPEERSSFASLDAAAVALREALIEGVTAATAGAEHAALLLSGGEDSRAVLGATPAGVRMRGVTYAERENREIRTARRVAKAFGADFEAGIRSPDHYVRYFPEVSRLTGSHHGFFDVHGYGLAEQLGLGAEPCVLGGLSADSLLKLYHRQRRPGPYRSARVPGVRETLLEEVDARRNAFIEDLRQLRPHTAGEWLSLWPFAMRKHGGNVDGNRRLFRSFEAFHVTAILDIAAAAPETWKRQRRLYRAAVRPLLAPTRFLPHTAYRFPYFGPLGNALLLPGLVVGRALRQGMRREVGVRHGSWPKWRNLVDDMTAYETSALADSAVPGLISSDPRELAAAVRHWPPLRRLMLTQLGWLELQARTHRGSSRNSPDSMSSTATRPASMT